MSATRKALAVGWVAASVSLLGLAAAPARAVAAPLVTFAFLPTQTTVAQISGVEGMAPGLLGAGMGSVEPTQTYLDISQGNRVFDSSYDTALPALRPGRDRVAGWGAERARAGSPPAQIIPGLLASTLRRAGLTARAAPGLGLPSVAAADESGRLERGRPPPGGGLLVRAATVAELPALVGALRDDDLLIAVTRPGPGDENLLPLGIAGRGFDGNLTSPSTRMDGLVLATDLAPTTLDRLGIAVPEAMSGQPIEAEAGRDPAAVSRLRARLAAIQPRRAPVIGIALGAWFAALALAALLWRRRAAATGVRLLALSVVYLPLALLLAAALEPALAAECVLVAVAAPLAALLTLLLLRDPWRALALSSALTVAGYAADVIAGSPLTPLSLLGSDPALGVRFYGIGNELGALLAVLIIAGTGAALSGLAPNLTRRRGAFAFLAAAVPIAFIFAAGPFGAKVGAATVIPLGAAAAAVALLRPRGRAVLGLIAVPLAALAILAGLDLLFASDTHFTRSVLDAGGPGQLADVIRRRLDATFSSFIRPSLLLPLPILLVVAALALRHRAVIGGRLAGVPAMRAGLVGALVGTVIGSLANDSGLLLGDIGGAYLLAFLAYTWVATPDAVGPAPQRRQREAVSLIEMPTPSRTTGRVLRFSRRLALAVGALSLVMLAGQDVAPSQAGLTVVLAGGSGLDEARISLSADGRAYVIESPRPLEVTGSVCRVAAGDRDRLECPATAVGGFRYEGGPGNSTVIVGGSVRVPVTLRGGTGDDLLVGGSGNDLLVGGRGEDVLVGGAGNDRLNGGRGDDLLVGGPGHDVCTGGGGEDAAVGCEVEQGIAVDCASLSELRAAGNSPCARWGRGHPGALAQLARVPLPAKSAG